MGDIVVIGNVSGRDAANVHKELLDFVLLMVVGDDVRFRAAIKGHVTNFSVQRKYNVSAYVFLRFHSVGFLIDFTHLLPVTEAESDVRWKVAPSLRLEDRIFVQVMVEESVARCPGVINQRNLLLNFV